MFFENLDEKCSIHLIKCLIMIGVKYKHENQMLKLKSNINSTRATTPISKLNLSSTKQETSIKSVRKLSTSINKDKDPDKDILELKKQLNKKDEELAKLKNELSSIKGCVKTSKLIINLKL